VVRIADRNWLQVEEYLAHDDRVVLPVGSTEQHAHLSLATDSILAERVAVEDRERLRELEPAAVKAAIGDGSYGGPYQVADEDTLRVWAAGVGEVRTLIESL
jgi:creatinine amidohydrolase/Fe(II)-dependent formamide hydrolase-like protein